MKVHARHLVLVLILLAIFIAIATVAARIVD